MKDTYDPMKLILDLIGYERYKWNNCDDLKINSLVLKLQLGYTKHMCFLCLWINRHDSNHFTAKEWPPRVEQVIRRYNVQHMPLVDLKSVYLPPLHIKLGMMENFVKGMDINGMDFGIFKTDFAQKKAMQN